MAKKKRPYKPILSSARPGGSVMDTAAARSARANDKKAAKAVARRKRKK